VDLNVQPGGMAGPPSIKAPMPPTMASAGRAPVSLPAAPPPAHPSPVSAPPRYPTRLPLGGGDPAWRGVHGGLGMIRWALWLCALVFIGFFAHAVWCV